MVAKFRPAWIIAKREVRDQFRDWRIIFPIVFLTVFFPYLMNFTAGQMLGFVEKYGADIIGERFIPFFLMIVGFFPISVSLVIALDTFVGEKERGSIEPLLDSPLEDWQLYLGKLFAATVPPLVASYLGMGVYLVGLALDDIPLPNGIVLTQIILLATVQAIVMVSGAVVVSTQATSVRAANLLASFIIIPMSLLVQGESMVLFWGDYNTLWWAIFGLLILAVLFVRVGLAHFQREELLGREIDILNFRWMWNTFWVSFTGKRTSVLNWYRFEVLNAVRKLKTPFLLVLGSAMIGIWIGFDLSESFVLPLAELPGDQSQIRVLFDSWLSLSVQPVLIIWWHNFRVLLLSMILGGITIGIFSVIPMIGSTAVIGYLLGVLNYNGFEVWKYALLIVPHGIIELPIAILATAAVLQAGAMLATPNHEQTVGEVALIAFANWAKILIGIVMPLLLFAAVIEAWITPRLALWLLF